MSRFLVDEYPLVLLPQLAMKIGLNEAVILQQIHYWLQMNKRQKKKAHYRDGRWWTYNTIKNWQVTNFPFWSEATIKRTLYSLREANIVIATGEYNRAAYDKTLWYSIDYEALDKAIGQNDQRVSRPIGQNDQMDEVKMTQPIPETTRDYQTETVSQKTEKPKPDYLDLVLETKAVQDKARLPITYLSETVADLLGLAKVPNYQYEQRWEEPLRDLLDQADGDIDRVEVALRAAAPGGNRWIRAEL